jgi:hypothetical protein
MSTLLDTWALRRAATLSSQPLDERDRFCEASDPIWHRGGLLRVSTIQLEARRIENRDLLATAT